MDDANTLPEAISDSLLLAIKRLQGCMTSRDDATAIAAATALAAVCESFARMPLKPPTSSGTGEPAAKRDAKLLVSRGKTSAPPTAYTLQEVASILRCSYEKAVAMARKGMLPTFRVGRLWRVRPKEFHAQFPGIEMDGQPPSP